MKCSTELEIGTKQVEEAGPKLASKAWIPIKCYHFGWTMQSKDIVNKEFGIFNGCHLLCARGKMDHFGHLVHKHRYGGKAIGL